MTRRRKPAAALTARNADPHHLYEVAVQRPEVIVGFIDELFETVRGHLPRVLREDFCGTANLSSTWVRLGDDRRALAVDHDAEVLDWAERHNRRSLGADADRLTLHAADVLAIDEPAEVVASLNYSHFIYKRREELGRYLAHARRCLQPGGMLLLDAFGGPGSIEPCLDERPFSAFTYLWEQRSFNPLTHEIDCRIHFRFPNGSMLRDAFVYDWRMWGLPELRELLEEVGFDDLAIYFESEEGFVADVDEIDPRAWVAYVVALKD
jgi:SAM-dependent methyltransferase